MSIVYIYQTDYTGCWLSMKKEKKKKEKKILFTFRLGFSSRYGFV